MKDAEWIADLVRHRLREAKGIGTPATRAEIIRGLKAQEFLVAAGKHIVPTERGLALFGILLRADPALVDPGVTAQLECLLDEVLVGRQEMMGAIDAVCAQAERIIGRLTGGAGAGTDVMAALGSGSGQGGQPQKRTRRKTAGRAGPGTGPRAPGKRPRAMAAPPAQQQPRGPASPGETPLRIPFGNKDAAPRLGARYRAGGWYAPPGADLRPFQEHGWL